MTDEQIYRQEAAAEYDHAFSHVSAHFVPFLLQAARLAPGQRVLDVATGTGIAAEAALAVVGPGGSVVAADISPEMIEKARQRLGVSPSASAAVEDGQALSFPDESFDAVLCSLGLMFFPDPGRGLSEFHRVLRPDGWAAVSVTTSPERSYNGMISLAVARHVPSVAAATARRFTLGDEGRLRSLFEDSGFRDVDITTKAHRFTLSSFDAYFGPFERGGGSSGQVLVMLPAEARHAAREEIRRDLRDTGGPIDIEVEFRIASGRR
ncbi:class I SAM-dependent methyltransferase [Microvirga calopogonii]|uniref:class I SAM-dependent methyltransferase n=1 Tax=Microvirga calopogonii TaxID=2078013 RepID=UPI000E0D623B|nr:methyltransferase domain-containing protein [Microvirga calopogonii]